MSVKGEFTPWNLKTLRILRHSVNAFSEPRPSRTVELVEAIKSRLTILLIIVYKELKLDVGHYAR